MMSLEHSAPVIEYPESDGKPMGETDLHIQWMFWLREMLKWRYRGQQVYVANNLLLYYQEGDPTKFVVPDCFVVKECDPKLRRTFKVWEEGKIPSVVVEVTSASSQREDSEFKAKLYARLGVSEYFLYDPTKDYLDPALRGYRLGKEPGYAPIEPDAQGRLRCEQLGILFCLAEADLVLTDPQTGERLLTEGESERAARTQGQKILEQERAARRAAEAELDRLREQVRRLGGDA